MNTGIKLYRVILNVLFYIFYVLIVSIAFSFVFPTILVILGEDILSPNNPIFNNIQYVIIILVLFLSLLFRKIFYLPIRSKVTNYNSNKKFDKNTEDLIDSAYGKKKQEIKNKNENISFSKDKVLEGKRFDNEVKKRVIRIEDESKIIIDNEPTLDIKIGKEII